MTVIDTPGFGDEADIDKETVAKVVEILREKVKRVNVFILAVQGTNIRFTKG